MLYCPLWERFVAIQGSIYGGGGWKLLPQTLKLPPKLFSQLQFKIMALRMLLMRYIFDCCVQLLIMKDSECNHSMGSLIDGTPPQSEVQLWSFNQRYSGLLLSVDFWNDKGKEGKVMPPGVEPRASGLSRQYSAARPRHPLATTPPSSPFTLLLSD